ncbi:O-antigen ligase family protein [Clostridium sp. OS1-26]|uniref:O-antigen ligase family protein n=1 Tax=Clostridium sp. OS1-26 TaxID=3070681 RepID=UPI0027DF20BA|nr:O-antigen ligase family protein [Clostridium sp. OS1-26]WML36741.1 O-antigen ligase family protein [Clostridium sp. OS1-26]
MRDDLYRDMYGETGSDKWYYAVPLAFLVSVVPLIVYAKVMNLQGDYFKYWGGASQSLDFFSYYKAVWIIISLAFVLIAFLISLFSKNIKINKMAIYIPIAVYSIMVILSTVFSDYKQIALFGFVERYEGMLVILSYIIILFITINLVKDEESIKVILISLICSAIVIGTIGILQYFGHDFYKTLEGRKLILPRSLQDMVQTLKFQFGDKIIYSTLYHYNYVGSYMAMLFPLTFTMFLLIKNKFYKILVGIVSVLMFLNLILCHSRAGIVGGAVSMIVLIIVMRNFFIKNWKVTVGAVLVAIVALVGFNAYSKGELANRIGSLFKDAETLRKDNQAAVVLKDIKIQNDIVEIVYSNQTLKIKNTADSLVFEDASNNIINSNVDKVSGKVILLNDKYKDCNIIFKDYSNGNKKYVVQVTRNGVALSFWFENDKFSYLNYKGDPVAIKNVEKWGFEGKEKLGSARGYIWSRSIPLLKHTFILGYGPDTFAAVFPQDDYVGKLIAYDTDNMLVDKAHNIYLENAINIGIIGTIAFLAIFVMYFISSIKMYIKRDYDDFYSIAGLAIFVSVMGYLGAGFFNDSVVSVAPVFWVLLGIGISINYKLKNDMITDKSKA